MNAARRQGLKPLAQVLTFLSLFVALPSSADEAPPPAANLEGRPISAEASPLQTRLDAAEPATTIEITAGTYDGDLVIEKPLRLVGVGRPLLRGSGSGSVVRVRAADVTIEGFDIDGRGGGDLGRDSSGIHVAAPGVTIRDVNIMGSLFGIYLRAADRAQILGCHIEGVRGKDAGEKGSGVHLWNTHHFLLEGNTITGVRDGIYVQSSTHGVVRGNTARDLRYGLHYMFSDDNLFEDNTFEDGAAGTALMFSKRITFRRNRFLRNRGFASVGLLLKACDEVVAEDNLIYDNARGIFLEGSYRNQFQGNLIAAADTAVVLYDSCAQNRFEGNTFLANLSPLLLVGRRTDTVFRGNYFADHLEPDLDGDGLSDRPYRLTSVFDHFRGNLTAADLMAKGPAVLALGAAEMAFPILEATPVVDPAPLARPPEVQIAAPRRSLGVGALGVWISAASLALGFAALSRARRPA